MAALRNAGEGWYVEYKREVSNAASIAKSVSAFANTYGGWLFYGVDEKSKDDAVAGDFPGIARADVDPALQRMRQAVAAFLAPAPHFDTKVIWGPCAESGLPDDHAVIVVRVPWSAAAPHVHKSGQIYRRVADGSEPKPENDRFLLDQLFRRADKIRDQYKSWVDKDPELSDGEKERPYLRLLIAADLWRDREIWCDTNVEELRAIMMATEGSGTSVPFETVYTSANGFVARQLADNDPANLGLTWRFRQDLRSEILIPLNTYLVDTPQRWTDQSLGFEQAERFGRMLKDQRHDDVRIVDLNLLFNILSGIVKIQERLSNKAGWTGPLFFKGRLLNVWRTCPFIDIDAVLDQFEAYGLPMCMDGNVTIYPGSDPESFVEIDPYEDVEVAEARIVLKTLRIFQPIARAFGVPEWIDMEDVDAGGRFFTSELLQAGVRGVNVAQRRAVRERGRRAQIA